MTNYSLFFSGTLMLNVVLTIRSMDVYQRWTTSSRSSSSSSSCASASAGSSDNKGSDNKGDITHQKMKKEEKEWKLLLRKYLIVYLLAKMSDWFKGPYVYALYGSPFYAYSQYDIAVLFVAAFASSMLFGSFVGGMADAGGRRLFVIVFTVVFAISCVTKHFKHFGILLFGRFLEGIATSLLFSVFDAWLIRAHADRRLPKQYLSQSFGWASYGNSIVAILAGIWANQASNAWPMKQVHNPFAGGDGTDNDNNGEDDTTTKVFVGGYLIPFDIAFVTLILCGICAATLWEENYGAETTAITITTSSSSKTLDDGDSKQNDLQRPLLSQAKSEHDDGRMMMEQDGVEAVDIPAASTTSDTTKTNSAGAAVLCPSPSRTTGVPKWRGASTPNKSDTSVDDDAGVDHSTTTPNGAAAAAAAGDSDHHPDDRDNNNNNTSSKDTTKWYDAFVLIQAYKMMIRSPDILLCGIISSLYEGSMYIFVFMWTPALTNAHERNTIGHKSSSSGAATKADDDAFQNTTSLPFGIIFSTFMVCCMAGSSLYIIIDKHYKTVISGERLAVWVFGISSFSMAVIAWSSSSSLAEYGDNSGEDEPTDHSADYETIQFLAMNVFELCVGMYFPIMGTMKGSIVPESKRAAIYNLYRIPLNFVVLFSLLTDFTVRQSFMINAIMLGIATVLQYILFLRTTRATTANLKDDNVV